VAELTGRALEEVRAVQRAHDPRLAGSSTPHITLVGSSGVGPIVADTRVERMREVLGPIAHEVAPLPMRARRLVRISARGRESD
jgi:hypothetical protein